MDPSAVLPNRAATVRRNTRLLVLAQAALWSALAVFVVHAPLEIVEVTGRRLWSGVLIATLSLSEGVGAFVGGRIMDRIGRRVPLLTGYALILVGAAAIGVGGGRSAIVLLVATAVLGAGAGVALLGRLAAGEMYAPDARGKAIGFVLLGGTVGAVGAPPLVGSLADALAPAVAWIAVALAAAVGVAATTLIRPDPRDLAVEETHVPGTERRSVGAVLRTPPLIAALATIGVTQMAMVGIMGVAAVVVHDHGGSGAASSLVVSIHLGGMFAFSPLIGAALDRWGRRRGLFAAGVVSVGGAVLAAMAEGTVSFGLGLFLVGLGWSGAYLGATAIVSDVTTTAERAGVLGATDLVSFLASTVGALAGGFLLDTAGLGVLGLAMAVILLPALALVLRLREPSPGRWATAEG